MSIKIQTNRTAIPVELGELRFEFDVSDESVNKFRKNASKIQQELANIDPENDEKAIDASKDILRRGFDLILGEGAFDKVYNLTPSVLILTKYLIEIAEGIDKELKEMGFNPSAQDKVRKYLQQKNRG